VGVGTSMKFRDATVGKRAMSKKLMPRRQLKFYQEIYDERGNLVEVHEKYPVDRGHRKL